MKYLGFVVGCAATGAAADIPNVAVDIAPVHSIVSAVMGDLGTPDLVIPAGASPHEHSLRPSEARALDQADVVVWMGHSLTPWLESPVETLAGDAAVVELLDHPQTLLLDVRKVATFGAHEHGHDDHDDHDDEEHANDHDDHDEEHDHDDHDDHDDHGDEEHADADDHDGHGDEEHADAHGHDDHDEHGEEKHADAHDDDAHDDEEHADAHDHDAHEGADPHAWLDPNNAIIWAGAIAQLLGEKDPENAETYTENAQAFQADIEALKGEVAATLDPIKGRSFVVFHDAYHYFEDRFGIEAAGAVSASDAVSPSAGRVAELRETIAELEAVCALTEPQYNPGIVDAIGTTELGEIDPLGVGLDLGAGLYRDLLSNMASSLYDCLAPPA
ncbi:MAG: zinc ABC transporter substrate-binding protein [Tateyamaria sp.]|uniref:zinc ABC transporter substrate-binding protein n=1 Tax=Tateyamaria sp. TaxID=1929288 RepID=UPI00329F3C1D